MAGKRKLTNKCVACRGDLEPGKRVIRGCHERCYRAAVRHAKSTDCDLSRLVRDGILLEASRGGRPKIVTTKKGLLEKLRGKKS